MIQVYTGNGKGKTTAALGLALRAAGSGFKVYIAQFVKGADYGELHSLKKINNITIEQFGRPAFINKTPCAQDFRLAQKGLKKVKKALSQKKYKVVVMDEINIALKLGLFKLKELLKILKSSGQYPEIILTGRYAPKEILKIADLVSEIREKKHYYKKGVKARKGIEF